MNRNPDAIGWNWSDVVSRSVSADVGDTDIVAPDDENVRLRRLREDGGRRAKNAREQSE